MFDLTAPHMTDKFFEPLVKVTDNVDKLYNSRATFFVLTIISVYVGYRIAVGLHRGG
jgi:hypothetical protein